MQDLIKVSEVSSRYGVSTRALRYYEDMGLIQSKRIDGYSYRMYDNDTIMRIEQILVLRKLNISIRDIKSIFCTDSSKTVLDILTEKTQDIDEEVSLLHELKHIVLDFIKQIEESNFNCQDDVRRLYKRANELEYTLLNINYDGNSSQGINFFEVTNRTRKLLTVRVIELPDKKVALLKNSSDKIPYNIENLGNTFYPAHFSWFNRYTCSVEDFIILPDNFIEMEGMNIGHFPGGIFAVAVLQGDSDWGIETDASLLYKWVGENGYTLREEANLMWNSLQAIGNSPPLFEMYVPIAMKEVTVRGHLSTPEKVDGLLSKLRIKKTVKQELSSLIRKDPVVSTIYGGELSIFNEGNDVGGMFTSKKYSFPLMVKIRAKTDSTNIRLGFAQGALVFDWGIAADSLIGRDISDGSFFHHESGGYIPINEYADIIWILEREYMAVAVNGNLRLYGTDMPYIKLGNGFSTHDFVLINAAFKSTVTIKEFEVSELI